MFEAGDAVSVIGPEAYFQGTLSAKGSLRVDGKMDGTITDAQSVIIGSTGKVEGDIAGETVVVGGEVKGNICASQFTELLASARVTGDIRTAKILVEEGAYFEGSCSMLAGEERKPAQEEEI